MIEIPLGLKHALESGECVLFVGAGLGANMICADGNPAPTGPELAAEMTRHFGLDVGEERDLAKISELVELRAGRPNLEGFVRKRLDGVQPDEHVQWLPCIRWKAIYTTNYDFGLQRAYEMAENPPQAPVTITLTSNVVNFDLRFQVPIVHLHGTLFATDRPNIIITERDYARFRETKRMLFELLKTNLATSSILYVGYSNNDPNWKLVHDELLSEFYPSVLPHSYRIAPNTAPVDRELLVAKNIESIDATYEDFVAAASAEIREAALESGLLEQARKRVPSDLGDAFDKSPAATVRLLQSWDYVNQVPFDEQPNISDFLHGDRPNWGLLANGDYFQRDIEEEVYDTLLDYAAGSGKRPRVAALLGPAGYGVTTLLMVLSTRIVKEGAKGVFLLKPGCNVLEGDVEFACSLFPDNPLFFIDNAADHATVVYDMAHRFREVKRAAMFMLGERLNEWRQGSGRLRATEFELEPLSDGEIIRLLDCLAKHAELGVLADLSRDHQIAVVKEKHAKQLLVAMREATEGRSFDAILEDEYWAIDSQLARRLYLVVCTFCQHGSLVRDELLSRILGTDLMQLYKDTRNWTEGVVLYESLGRFSDSYHARARHRIIAEIVWERCATADEKEELLKESLECLNLNYPLDKDAFDSFVRSDRSVDGIASLEGRTSFFETACKKDPTSPYVRQHYARMLNRSECRELALSKIEAAIHLNPQIRVLYHTKGVILARLAQDTIGRDFARRRLSQSEGAFRHAISLYQRDEYAYHGLADLYFKWATACPSEEETAEYISKAEEVISEALGIVHVHDRLLIVSSKISDFLGNKPAALAKLEEAVGRAPDSVVARYLLGRAFRQGGEPEKAMAVLDPIIKARYEEFRSFIEYALAMLDVGSTYEEAAAVLQLSKQYGSRDARFIATLGGFLYMAQDFTAADEVFSQPQQRYLTARERQRVYYRPSDPSGHGHPLRVRGKVVLVKAGYALVDVPGLPRVLCPNSKIGPKPLRGDMRVELELGFAAKGAIADSVRVIARDDGA